MEVSSIYRNRNVDLCRQRDGERGGCLIGRVRSPGAQAGAGQKAKGNSEDRLRVADYHTRKCDPGETWIGPASKFRISVIPMLASLMRERWSPGTWCSASTSDSSARFKGCISLVAW